MELCHEPKGRCFMRRRSWPPHVWWRRRAEHVPGFFPFHPGSKHVRGLGKVVSLGLSEGDSAMQVQHPAAIQIVAGTEQADGSGEAQQVLTATRATWPPPRLEKKNCLAGHGSALMREQNVFLLRGHVPETRTLHCFRKWLPSTRCRRQGSRSDQAHLSESGVLPE